MIVHGIHGAAHEAGAMDHKMSAHVACLSTQAFNHGDGGSHPVRLLQTEPMDIHEHRTLIGCGYNGQDRHQIGDIAGIDFDIFLQSLQKRSCFPVPLGRVGVQILNLHFISQRLGRQPEGAITPVALHRHGAGGMELGRAEQPQRIQGQIDVGHGFHFSGERQITFALDQILGKQQSCDKLAGYAAVDDIVSRLQLACTPNGIRGGTGQGTSHPLHLLPQGGQRPLRQPSSHLKSSIHAQCAHDGQQKTQCGAAFTAVEDGSFRNGGNGIYAISDVSSSDICAQCVQTVHRGFNIPVGFRADQRGLIVRKGGADQIPMGDGLGGDYLNFAL